jgi:diguanylate cyclase (GGDEF)-like protein
VAVTAALLAAVSFGVDAGAVIHNPPLVIAPMAAVMAVAILSTALMNSDREHRSEAVIDQLTGMLNRKALAPRAHELAQQSLVSGEPIGVIIGDLDHFKRVNDTHGHVSGDAVLRDVAYVLRKELRAFDLVYRLGGEEFLVLLPGADIDQAMQVAETLRQAVAAEPLGGEPITMSFGVGASERGKPFDYDAVFHDADLALYDAKRSGRDRVCRPAPALVPALAQ